MLRRPGCGGRPGLGGLVEGIREAAAAVARWPGESVFLTTGRRDLDAFAADGAHQFLVRTVDPPDGPGRPA